MRAPYVRRWATLAVVAVGPAGLTVTGAATDVKCNTRATG
jgi:hypothetical protein